MPLQIFSSFTFSRTEAKVPQISHDEMKVGINIYENETTGARKSCSYTLSKKDEKITAYPSQMPLMAQYDKVFAIAAGKVFDPKKATTQKGKDYIKMSIAVGAKFYVTAKFYGKLIERFENATTKNQADQIQVSGMFSTREYDGKVFLDIMVNDFTILKYAGEKDSQESTPKSDASLSFDTETPVVVVADDAPF